MGILWGIIFHSDHWFFWSSGIVPTTNDAGFNDYVSMQSSSKVWRLRAGRIVSIISDGFSRFF